MYSTGLTGFSREEAQVGLKPEYKIIVFLLFGLFVLSVNSLLLLLLIFVKIMAVLLVFRINITEKFSIISWTALISACIAVLWFNIIYPSEVWTAAVILSLVRVAILFLFFHIINLSASPENLTKKIASMLSFFDGIGFPLRLSPTSRYMANSVNVIGMNEDRLERFLNIIFMESV